MLIGLDKQTIKPTIKAIDIGKLKKDENVIIDTEGLTVPIYDYVLNKDVRVKHINITDNIMFNRLTVGTYKADMGIGSFCYLDISKMGADDCNLVPYTVDGFKIYTDKCIRYIHDRYGLELANNNYKGEQMEMNITIELEEKFDNYIYLLELFRMLSPSKKRYKSRPFYDEKKEITGIELKNKSVKKKIYDKRKQLEEEKEIKIKLDKEYMRIEDTLLHQDKIKSVFGTYNIADITDKDIYEYMRKSIDEDLIKPLEKHIEISNKRLLKIAKEEKQKNAKKWVQSFIISALAESIKKAPILVDKQQIIDIIKTLDKKNYNRTIKRAKNDLDKLDKYENNFARLSEIKFKCNIK